MTFLFFDSPAACAVSARFQYDVRAFKIASPLAQVLVASIMRIIVAFCDLPSEMGWSGRGSTRKDFSFQRKVLWSSK